MNPLTLRIDDMGSLGGHVHALCGAIDVAGRTSPRRTIEVTIGDRLAAERVFEAAPLAWHGTADELTAAGASMTFVGPREAIDAVTDALQRGIARRYPQGEAA